MKDYIVFGQPQISEDEIQEVVSTLRTNWVGTGPKVSAFEKSIQTYKSASHAVAVNSCTAALHLSLIALRLSPGDEVITTDMTFCSTVNAIIHSGATPVLVDCDLDSRNISIDAINRAITPKTKAIIPVHMAGYPCDMTSILAIAKQHNLSIIEDCAHAIESRYNGIPLGTLGDFGCLSFYATKNICTAEGGMILTKHPHSAKEVKQLALHGLSSDAWSRFSDKGYKHYLVDFPGYKYNLTDLAASLGLRQMEKIDSFHQKRQAIFRRYNEAFKSLPLRLPLDTPEEHTHGYHLYSPVIKPEFTAISRDDVLIQLHNSGIGVGVHYLGLHCHPYYKQSLLLNADDFPNSQIISDNTFSLPLTPFLTENQVSRIISEVQSLFTN
ncbi:DegT/DnrJ/EryC1/StrS family aminotransferase [bacterium]|nr:DegT/DnrJ/EryC1/StrS family aminotransferase [bacterium]